MNSDEETSIRGNFQRVEPLFAYWWGFITTAGAVGFLLYPSQGNGTLLSLPPTTILLTQVAVFYSVGLSWTVVRYRHRKSLARGYIDFYR
jgi:hypothetical protein